MVIGYKDYFRVHIPTAHHVSFDILRGTDLGVPVQYLPDELFQGLSLDLSQMGAIVGHRQISRAFGRATSETVNSVQSGTGRRRNVANNI